MFGVDPGIGVKEHAFEHCREQLFEIFTRQRRKEIFVGDHFALFGELDRTVQDAEGLRENRVVRRTPAATNAAAAPVKESKADAESSRRRHEADVRRGGWPTGKRRCRRPYSSLSNRA